MKTLVFENCKSEQDIINTVENALEYDNVVVNEEGARQYFRDAEIEGDVTTHVIVSTHVSIWNEKHQGEEVFNVTICEHFVDAGSDDYCYSYNVC